MSQDIDIRPDLRVRLFCLSGSGAGLVVAGGVQDQLAQEFTGVGVDDADGSAAQHVRGGARRRRTVRIMER